MSWITVIWSMAAAACLTLATVHLLAWWRNRALRASALFSGVAIGIAIFAAIEVWMMRAATPGEYAVALRWAHVPAWLIVVGMVEFVRVYLRAGRPWLAWTVIGLRSLALLLNFLAGTNLNFNVVTGLRRSLFLGEAVSIPVGTPNPAMLIGQFSLVLFWIFVVDAALAVSRRGERRQALVIGGSMVFFTMAATAQSVVVFWGLANWPLTASLCFLPVVVAMGLELSRDIFQMAQLRSELHESEQQMLLAAQAAKLGFWIRQTVGGEVWASPSWRELFGFGSAEPLDLARMLERVHPDDRDQVRETLLRAETREGHYDIQYRLLLRDGQLRWIASHGRVDYDSAGRPGQVRGVSLDITQLKQSELDALRQREELAHVSRVSVLGELSGSIAHELNQPLTAILSNAQAVQGFLARTPPDLGEVREIMADIVAEDIRAGEVIHRLRQLLRKGEVQRQPHSVNLVVEDVARFLRSDLTNREVTLQTELAPDLPEISCDRVQLQQVLLNLVVNGCDAMNRLAPAARRLVIRTSRDGEWVSIAVVDGGAGIPPDLIERIFEPFFTTKAHGLGMGLSVCRTIVTAHGGRLWARNNPEGGATITCALPMRDAEPGVAR